MLSHKGIYTSDAYYNMNIHLSEVGPGIKFAQNSILYLIKQKKFFFLTFTYT